MSQISSAGVLAPRLPRARGAVDACTFASGGFHVGGWLLHPTQPFERATLAIDGTTVAECGFTPRADVAAAFSHLPHAGECGFNFHGRFDPAGTGVHVLTVTGIADGRPYAALRAHHCVQPRPGPLPAEHLRVRVAGSAVPQAFTQNGLDGAFDMMDMIEQHRGLARTPRVLDWGCGSGRLTAELLHHWPQLDVMGCDLDPEAVAWCNQHLRADAFQVTAPYPPLPFADASFDAVLACSVMTHLEWSVQRRWLPEIRRILRPGGLFVATVHGAFAAAFADGVSARLARKGTLDKTRDRILDGIAPSGYYRCVYQTEAFTRDHWGQFLPVVAYEPGGLAGMQDLVVLRKDA